MNYGLPPMPLPEPIRVVSRALPFGGDVAHGAEETFVVSVDTLYRPRRLVISPESAPYYDVLEIRAGIDLLLEGPIAASTFPPIPDVFANVDALRIESSFRDALREFIALFDKCDFRILQVGQTLSVTVRHREVCPVHPDCVALSISCRGVPLRAHWEGMVAA